MEWITWACCAVSCCLLNADHRMPQNITTIMVERYVAWLLWSGHTIIISSSSSAFAFIFAASEDGFKFKKTLTIRTLASRRYLLARWIVLMKTRADNIVLNVIVPLFAVVNDNECQAGRRMNDDCWRMVCTIVLVMENVGDP